MGKIGNNGQPLPITPTAPAAKPEAQVSKDRETLTEKFFSTEMGGFYKDAPVLSGVATGVTALGVVGLGAKYENLGELLFNKNSAGLLTAGAGALLIEEGIDDLNNGKQMSGAIKTSLGGVAALGGTELLTGAKVLSKPVEILTHNGYAMGGAAIGAGSAYLIKDGISDFNQGEKIRGGLKTAAGAVGGLGAVELVGRQFDKSLVVEPLVELVQTKGAQIVGAGAGAVAGAGLIVDGAKRLAENGDVLNDALGVAEVSGGALLGASSASLMGIATGSEMLAKTLPKTAKGLGAAALTGSAYVLGKETLKSAKEDGLTYMNAATGTGAALSALGAIELMGAKGAFTKGGQIAGAVGVGAASGLLATQAYQDIKEGQYGEGALKGFGAVVGGGAALALANVPGVRDVGEAVVEGAVKHVIAPVGEFAVKNPFVAIPLAVGGAYAAYKLMDKGDEPKEATVLPEGGTPLSATQGVGSKTKIEE